MKKSLLTLTVMLVAAALIVVFCGPAMAKVKGRCDNCHTMHNSEGGADLYTTPYDTLLKGDCVGCHTGENTGGISFTGATPYVMSTSAPDFDSGTLAGGNFYWVSDGCTESCGDAKGHNVLGISTRDTLAFAPGDSNAGCAPSSCHTSLAVENTSGTLPGKSGCEGCHLNVMHHANDGSQLTKYVDTAAKGWYRFLSGHATGEGYGVKGIEEVGWGHDADVFAHNEYLGDAAGTKLGDGKGNMSAYCMGCHGGFHDTDTGGWIRHPSDFVIPDTAGSEYASMSTEYNPDTPVARPSGFNWGEGDPSTTVAAGTDMVMCLSCHVAHGSPYDDLLRWDYTEMVAGSGNDTDFCFVCHTRKDTGG